MQTDNVQTGAAPDIIILEKELYMGIVNKRD